MRLLIILNLLISNVLYANEFEVEKVEKCDLQTDIVFVNGVFNPTKTGLKKAKQVIDNTLGASFFSVDGEDVLNASLVSNTKPFVDTFHNKGSSIYVSDVVEASEQLIDEYLSNTIEDKKKSLEREAYTYLSGLVFNQSPTIKLSESNLQVSLAELNRAKLKEYVQSNPRVADVDALYKKVYEDRLSKNKRVILVSHSQGNLFANELVQKISREDPEKLKYFGNVRLASPSHNVYQSKNYNITMDSDFIINGLLGRPATHFTKPEAGELNLSARESLKLLVLSAGLSNVVFDTKTAKSDVTGHGALEVYMNKNQYISKNKEGPYLNNSAEYLVKGLNRTSLLLETNCSNRIPMFNTASEISYKKEGGGLAFVDFTVPRMKLGKTDLEENGLISDIKDLTDLRYYVRIGGVKIEGEGIFAGGTYRTTESFNNQSSHTVSINYSIWGKYKGKYLYSNGLNFVVDLCKNGVCCEDGSYEHDGKILCNY